MILLALSLLLAAPPASQPARVAFATFTVPVPAGFTRFDDPKVPPTTLALRAKKRVAPGAFAGSAVVSPVPPGPDFDAKDPKVCAEMGAGMTQQLPVKLERTRIVATGLGPTCQWELTDLETPTRGARGTLMCRTRADCWVLTCNYDLRDVDTRAACDLMLAGWRPAPQ